LKNLVLQRSRVFWGRLRWALPTGGGLLKDPRKKRQSVEGLEEFFNGLLGATTGRDRLKRRDVFLRERSSNLPSAHAVL
jgi:hypothetical protein